MNLQEGDQAAAAVAVAPRVTLADIEAATASAYFVNGWNACLNAFETPKLSDEKALLVLTLCIVVLKNGFVIVGKSAPASPENFNDELGKKLARDDATRQIWPLMGFALKDRLSRS